MEIGTLYAKKTCCTYYDVIIYSKETIPLITWSSFVSKLGGSKQVNLCVELFEEGDFDELNSIIDKMPLSILNEMSEVYLKIRTEYSNERIKCFSANRFLRVIEPEIESIYSPPRHISFSFFLYDKILKPKDYNEIKLDGTNSLELIISPAVKSLSLHSLPYILIDNAVDILSRKVGFISYRQDIVENYLRLYIQKRLLKL